MNPDLSQLQNQVDILTARLNQSVSNSSSITRDQETALRERLGIDGTEAEITALQVAVAAITTVPVGMIAPFAVVPSGWFACTGGTLSRTGSGAALFAVIGTIFGVGDGTTTFGIPDIQGKVIVDIGGSGVTAVGDTGGEQTHVIAESELPTNTTTLDNVIGGALAGLGTPSYGSGRAGGLAHNNMQPYMGLIYAIKL